jgi:molybdate transport system ATP-binding protein
MLEIDVKKKLRNFDLDVSLNVPEGEILMLVGENGCGKSTLLNMVAGLLSPDAGEITLAGEPLFDSSLRINLSPENRNIGYVFQNYALFPHLTVYENVAFGLRARRFSRQKIEVKVKEQLEAAGLWGMRDARAVKISGGQKQRTALTRALAIDSSLNSVNTHWHSLTNWKLCGVQSAVFVENRDPKLFEIIHKVKLCSSCSTNS